MTAALPRRAADWLASRTHRERRLLTIAGTVAAGALALVATRAVLDDLAALRARVAAREGSLVQVRRLAATLELRGDASGPDAPSLLARLQAAAEAAAMRDRVAAMTPVAVVAGEERVSARVAGASLAETVRLLHALDVGEPPIGVARLVLRKHPDDTARFDVTVEAALPRALP